MLGTLHTNLTESDWAASLVITLNNIGHNLSINYSWNGLVALCWILYTWTQPREGASDDNIEKSNNLKLQYNTARDQTGLLLSQTIETTRRSFEYFREGERERDRETERVHWMQTKTDNWPANTVCPQDQPGTANMGSFKQTCRHRLNEYAGIYKYRILTEYLSLHICSIFEGFFPERIDLGLVIKQTAQQ